MPSEAEQLNALLRKSEIFLKECEHANFCIYNAETDELDLVEVNRAKHGDFWDLYCGHVYKRMPTEIEDVSDTSDVSGDACVLDVAEIYQPPIDAVPLIVRIMERLRDDEIVDSVREIQTYLSNTFIFNEQSDNTLWCIALQSRNTTTLQFPMCRLLQRDIEQEYLHEISKKLEFTLDLGVYNSLPLYGSSDDIYYQTYAEIPEKDAIEKINTDQYMLDLSVFEPDAHTKVEQELIESSLMLDRAEQLDCPEKNARYWLPLILSVDYWRTLTRLRDHREEFAQQYLHQKRHYDLRKMVQPEPLEDDINTYERYAFFLGLWKPETIVSSKYWKLVGECFATLSQGSAEGLNAWIRVLEKALKEARDTSFWLRDREDNRGPRLDNIRKRLKEAYITLKPGRRDVVTLMEIAAIDSPEAFGKWHSDWVFEAVVASMGGMEGDVDHVVYRRFIMEVAYCQGGNRGSWYRRLGDRLVRDYGGIWLRLKIGGEILRLYYQVFSDLVSGGMDQGLAPTVIELLTKIISNLKHQGFKSRLLSSCAERFNTPNLSNYIDTDPEISLLKNCVMVATSNDLYIRRGLLQDYLHKSFGAAYHADYSWDHYLVQEVWNWSFITFVNADLIAFFWKFVASIFRGGNNDKKVMFFTGQTGNNMKSTWQHAIMDMCGDTAVTMPINYFTMGRGKANDASPAEIVLKGARIMFSEEPDEKVPLLVSMIKAAGSDDKVRARELYGESEQFPPTHKTVIVCNTPPPTGREGATEERVCMVPFISQAVFGAPEDPIEQLAQRKFPRNAFFGRKLPLLSDAILWIAIQFYPQYASDGLRDPPEEVVKVTQDYWKSIDDYNTYCEQYIVDDEAGSIDAMELASHFANWFGIMHKRQDPPDPQTIFRKMTPYLGERVAGTWYGKRLNLSTQRTGDSNHRPLRKFGTATATTEGGGGGELEI